MLTVSKGRSNATITAYASDFALLLQRIPVLESATSTDFDEYFATLRQEGFSPATIARSMSALRGLFQFLLDERLVSDDPTTLLPTVRRERSLPKALSERYIQELLSSISENDALSLRDRAIVEFLYGTGCRVSEMLRVRLADIDFDEDVIRVTGKGEKQRLVPIGSCLRTALREYLEVAKTAHFSTATAVFLNFRGQPLSRHGVNEMLKRRARQGGLPLTGLHAHSFRHSCATHMIAHGADIRVVQELLGHSSIATTQRYTSVALTTLKDAYGASHPRAN
jgi:integrase/recombinase XerD